MWKLLAKQFPSNIQKHILEKNNKKFLKGIFSMWRFTQGSAGNTSSPQAPSDDTAALHTWSGVPSSFSLLPAYLNGDWGSIYVYLN